MAHARRVRPAQTEALAPLPVARPHLPPADALLPYLRRIDEARWYSNFGAMLTAFEAGLAARFAQPAHIVTVANATQGLALTLKAMGLPAGSLCAMPAWTFVATAHAAMEAGLTPYFVDVDPADWMLQPHAVVEAIARAPGPVSVVIPVAAFGAMPDLSAWEAFRADTGVAVLIDAAAAFDAADDARLPLVVSLHATKVLGIGEGGFLATQDRTLAERVRQLTTYGFKGSRLSEIAATNAKLSEYAGAVGLAALDAWPHDRLRYLRTSQRMRLAMTRLPQVVFQPGWGLSWVTSVCCVRLPADSADAVELALDHGGVQTRRWWGLGCQDSPAFAACPRGDLTHTRDLGRSVLGLPFAIDLTDEDIDRVAGALGLGLAGL